MNNDFALPIDDTYAALSNTHMNLSSDINDVMLPDDMVLSAVTRACDFFGIPEVPVINAQGTCVWPNDTDSLHDDVFGFNREQLMKLGITGEDSLTLIYTHECAHRTLQGAYNDGWEEELACDFFAGVHAGLHNVNIDNFEAALGSTPGGTSHPNGALRANFIEFGQQVAQELSARGIEPTYDNCLARLNEHIEEKSGLITEYRAQFGSTPSEAASALVDSSEIHIGGHAKNATMADVEWYEHQARISSGSEQAHWIQEAKWARDHIKDLVAEGRGHVLIYDPNFKGLTDSPFDSGFDDKHPMPTYDQLRNAGFSEYLANQILHGVTHCYSQRELHDVLYSDDPVGNYNAMVEAKAQAALNRADKMIEDLEKEFGPL